MDTVAALSAKEVLEVIYNSDIEIYTKIPQKLICLLREIAGKCSEEVVLKKNTSIIDQPISEDAKAILALIYKDCIASEEQKRKWNKMYIEKQEEIYSVDNIFKNNKTSIIEDKQDETALVKIDNNKWYRRLFYFFKNLFKYLH